MTMVSYESLCVYWRWPSSVQRFQVYFVLAAAFTVEFSCGMAYTFGNMIPYIVSYIRQCSHPQEIRYVDGNLLLAGQIVSLPIAFIPGALIEEKVGPRMTI